MAELDAHAIGGWHEAGVADKRSLVREGEPSRTTEKELQVTVLKLLLELAFHNRWERDGAQLTSRGYEGDFCRL